MAHQSSIIVAAAALEQGLQVYRISLDPRVGKQSGPAIATSFESFSEGQLVVCEQNMTFFVARIHSICEDYEIEQIAECTAVVVQDAEPAYRKAVKWKEAKLQAKRRVATSQARAFARQMLEESGMSANELLVIEKEKE